MERIISLLVMFAISFPASSYNIDKYIKTKEMFYLGLGIFIILVDIAFVTEDLINMYF